MNKKTYLIVILLYCYIVLLFSFAFLFYFKSTHSSSLTSRPTSPFPSPITTPISHLSLPTLTLDSIFSPDHSWVNQLPQEQTITLITTGDIIPARTVNYKMTIYNDFTHPFLKTADFLKSADLTLINLESPLIKNCPVTNEGMVFCGNQKFIEGLKFADIDVVNLANNHTLNYGIEGIQQTIDLLENNNILPCGFPINNLTMKQFNPVPGGAGQAIKIGFLGWNLLEEFNEEEVLNTIKQAKKEVDLLIISLHWGAEYTYFPAAWQKALARQMIKAGADLIVGNHPHWIQPIEVYQNKVIIYAHANFIFDQEWSQETKTGFLAKTVFYENKIIDLEIFPIFISDYNQPELLKGEEKKAILDNLEDISNFNF